MKYRNKIDQPEGELADEGRIIIYGFSEPPPDPLTHPRIPFLDPQEITLPPSRYSWCTCGHSKRQPFCDDSHREPENGTNRKSYKFKVLEETKVLLCRCKYTRTPPFCDGFCETLKDRVMPE
ncbi:CDGSH iron-sulfur domain-containing protein [bacterium]|nr:CDGSH iron-sulfur domain-containing protein [bacterium]